MNTLILALFGVGVGIFLLLLFRPEPVKVPVVFRKTVYVDLNALERLHPQTELIADLNSLAAEVAAKGDLGMQPVNAKVESTRVMPAGISQEVSDQARNAMSANVLAEADRALDSWEQDRRNALDVRLAWSRKNMLNKARDAVRASKNDVYGSAGDQLLAVEGKYGLTLMNRRLQIRELELGSDLHGYHPPEIPPKLEQIRDQLQSLSKQYLGQKETVGDWMSTQISRIQSETNAGIDSTLSQERANSVTAIQTDVKNARERISSRLETINGAKSKRLVILPDAASDVIVRVRPELIKKDTKKIDIAALLKSREDIRKQIRNEIVSAVTDEADILNVRVVFSKAEAGSAEDLTEHFAGVVRRSVW